MQKINYKIIAIILIVIVLMFTSRSTFQDIRNLSDAIFTLREERQVSANYDNEEPEEKVEEIKEKQVEEVKEEQPKEQPVETKVETPVEKPKTEQPKTQPQVIPNTVVKEIPKPVQPTVQKNVYQDTPPKPKNPYQKLLDDDNFPANVYTPDRHIKYVVFNPSTLRYGKLTNTNGYSLNVPFGTEQERARNYWKIKNILDNSALNNKCIYGSTAEYRTSRATNYIYCDASIVSLNELEYLAETLQNKGYEVYLSDEIISKQGFFNGTQWIWKTYNGSFYN